MSFVTLNDLQRSRGQVSPSALRRHIGLLKARAHEYRKQIRQLQFNLNMDMTGRDIPMTRIRIDFLNQAIERIQRKIARLEHRCTLLPPEGAPWTHGRILSAEAQGISGLPSVASLVNTVTGQATAIANRITGKTTPGANAFPPLPVAAKGMGDQDIDSLDVRSLVVAEYVEPIRQEPLESAFDSTVGMEAGGEDMADPNDGGAELAFEGLTNGEAVDGTAMLEGLNNDATDAGGQEAFTDVPTSMSLDDGGAISGDLVEPGQGQQPQDMVYQEQQPDQTVVRQGNQRIAPAFLNTSRMQQVGVDGMQQARQPGTPGMAQYRTQTRQPQGQIQRRPTSRLDQARAMTRLQQGSPGGVQSTSMGQLPDGTFNLASQLINTGTQVGTQALGLPGAPVAPAATAPSSLSAYTPLLVVGGVGIAAAATWWFFFRNKGAKATVANPKSKKNKARSGPSCTCTRDEDGEIVACPCCVTINKKHRSKKGR
jgi:hypothetical protein